MKKLFISMLMSVVFMLVTPVLYAADSVQAVGITPIIDSVTDAYEPVTGTPVNRLRLTQPIADKGTTKLTGQDKRFSASKFKSHNAVFSLTPTLNELNGGKPKAYVAALNSAI